jgi:hypothetical protein
MAADSGDHDGSAIELPLRVTALVLLLDPALHLGDRLPIGALALIALLFPRALRSPLVWLAQALLQARRIGPDWMLADNHLYLALWWLLAIAIALLTPRAKQSLTVSARALVGLAFAFAVLWKAVLSPDFVDGRFFEWTFLLDGRFQPAVALATGAPLELFEHNEAQVRELAHSILLGTPSSAHLQSPARLELLARALAAWTLAIEGYVALSFLWPRADWLARSRDAALLAFCVSTYAVATVAGFGWLLLAIGLAQVKETRSALRLCYVGALIAVMAFAQIPWVEWLAGALG